MKWHVDGRMEDEMMRHPADSLAWKNFDNVHPSFALEPRNVRLGLASDGFNPFGNMSISYSMWPVVLIPYNLPPWMCMKQTFFMLSLLIPGPTALGNDIDIYLQPLIDELNDLWDVGVETYDASTKQNFCMQLYYGPSMIFRICKSFDIVGTLLSIDGKSKDNFNSRLDLQVMGIRDQLHPIQRGNRVILPAACYSLTSNEKKEFCKFLKEVKVPYGYASNISRCVQVNERKIFGLKSHDFLHKDVCAVIVELCSFFKQLCSKVLKIDQLEHLENDIIVTLCKLERIFPPSFFDVMVHLPIHLASEAKVTGPVQYRWMYPIERYLRTLKSYVRNKSRPEGSIAEGEHKQSIRVKPRIRARDVDLIHTREFISWFEEQVSSFASARDKNPIPGHVSYYGVLTDVIELHYLGGNRVILFKCDWWDVINSGRGIKKDEYGFTCLNFERTICTDEPFVLASQAKQVFYVQNSNEENWHTVVEIQTRGVYDMNQKVSTNDPEPYQQLITLHSQRDVHELVENDLINWDRNDIAGETIQTDVLLSRQENIVERDNEFIHDDDIDDVKCHIKRKSTNSVSEDELNNLQQLLDIQPAATTTPSSSDPSDSLDPSVASSSSSKKRTRGPTHNLDLLSMKPGEKKLHDSIREGKLFMMEKGKDYQAIWEHWCDLNTMYPSKFKIRIMLVTM
ncbi:hypothetical protein AAG906_005845 [Vitis piasezkii]